MRKFLERTGKNASYTSKISADFIEAVGLGAEESLLKRLHQTSCFNLMADDCTDTPVEELLIFCHWIEDGLPVEHFLEVVPLKSVDVKTIYSTLVEFLKEKIIQISKFIGMGFDGAATFSGNHKGVQSLLKKNSPHAVFVLFYCHLLQLACVQVTNNINGIKHVYVTLTSLWKFVHYSPKRVKCLKEVQRVLDLPELKTIKPSDTRWLAHKCCVKAVKASYSATVNSINNNIYKQTNESETLGIIKVLCKPSTVSVIYLPDYALPQVVMLSRSLQADKIDLTTIAPLVDTTPNALDDAIMPVANWVLELFDTKDDLETAIDIKITTESITSFQDRVTKPFITMLKNNISS